MEPDVLSPARSPRAWRWALVALAGSACLTPTDPGAGRVAELKVRAAFAPGADPGAMGVSVDSATVVATPLDGTPAVVDTAVPHTDLEATLSWIVDLEGESAPYTVRLELRGGGRRLYAGEDEIELNRMPLGDAPVHDVPVAYVGPGAVATVTVTPGAATLTDAGAGQPFTAEARDGDGALVSATFAWTTSDAAVATVDAGSGQAVAVATGVATITATANGVVGTATLTVALGGLFVEVAPASATIPALNASHQFTATARDGDGVVIADATFAWATDDAGIATVDATGLATAVAEGATVVSAETGGVTATADLRVTVVTTIAVSPAAATLTALGATQAFEAVARDANGDPVPGVVFAWSSSVPAVASVDAASGVATALANGTTTITAATGTASGSGSLEVAQAVVSFDVTPQSATLAALGATQQFTAVARDANGNTVPVDAVWSSSRPDVATVDPATGLATAVATGEATITAQAGAQSASAQLLVAPGGLTVEVTPTSATLTALGATEQFTAVARDGNGTVLTGASFAWIARDPAVVAVDDAGLATAVAEGTTWIVAALGDEADSAEIVVVVATTVEVAPAAATLAAFGATQLFTATARDADGTAISGVTFTWTSSDPAIATVDAATGVATAVANGAVTITAQAGDATGTASLTVTQAIAAVAVTPPTATLDALGATQAFTATARDANDNAVAGAAFTWASTDPATATVDPATGLATAVANGTVTISATSGGVTGTASLTVSQVAVSVAVTPGEATLTAAGQTAQFTATARDANAQLVAGATFVWSTSDPLVAAVDAATGMATAVGNGLSTITATTGTASGSAALTVAQVITSVDVTPASATLTAFGATQAFTATARDANGAIVSDVTVTWSSSDPAIAAVDPGTGLATAIADGTVAITAEAGDATGTASLTVAQAVAGIAVTPGSVTLMALDASQQFSATALDANGNPLTRSVTFTWTSTVPAVAIVGAASGLALAAAQGTTGILASAEGVTGGASLTVDQIVVRVEVTPPTATLDALGATQAFGVTGWDANDYEVADAVFTWETDDPAVATVDAASGLATAVGAGGTVVRAREADGAGGEATLTVAPVVVTVEVEPATDTLRALGATRQFAAVARDAGGSVITGVDFLWTADEPVADVDQAGLATAVDNGTTQVTATAPNGVADAATLVVAQQVTAIEVTPPTVTLAALGATQAFAATARDANGFAVAGTTFAWSSADPATATVDPASGIATAIANGTVTITATANGVSDVSGSATLTVAQVVASVEVTPAEATLVGAGETVQFQATARDANGQIVTNAVFVWASSDSLAATVDAATGLATAVAAGHTTITATSGGIVGSASLTVCIPSSGLSGVGASTGVC